MSQTESNVQNLDGVFYDREGGSFVMFEADQDTKEIILQDPFDGGEIDRISNDEFESSEFSRVDTAVLNDPASKLDTFVRDALSSMDTSGDSLRKYDPIDIEFALEILRFKRDEYKTAWEEKSEYGRKS